MIVGSNAFFPGINLRIQKELREIIYNENHFKEKTIKFPINVGFSYLNSLDNLSFLGASIIANIRKDDEYWISKKDWDEYGSNIILKKCRTEID